MPEVQALDNLALPSFSLVLETENLINADLEGLEQSLASLIQQDLPPTQANEVVIIDNGSAPANLIAQMQAKFPWIKVHQAPIQAGYYESKLLGAQLVTGEIVVYCDSDCIYEPHWLRTLLGSFQQQPEVQVVAGETSTRGLGIYGTAMALVYIFPQFSNQRQLTPTRQYFLNNVAFRREFLLQHPFPLELPLYRGNCLLHAKQLQQTGTLIWRQPQARSTHAAPNGLSHFWWRFLLIGHDYYWQKQLLGKQDPDRGNHRDPISGVKNELLVLGDRLRRMINNDPRHLWFLPLALPVVMLSMVLIVAGLLITQLRPHYLLNTYNKVLAHS